ncbi:MAG: hypothetical protein FWE02_06680 [Defluviitaleaceae bacterium]|nr:hypothetical protein [Defluviitaleaceae bacterium]
MNTFKLQGEYNINLTEYEVLEWSFKAREDINPSPFSKDNIYNLYSINSFAKTHVRFYLEIKIDMLRIFKRLENDSDNSNSVEEMKNKVTNIIPKWAKTRYQDNLKIGIIF